ncbi:hypothetical protein EJB05_03835, partial [Eragrostis curvula]
SEAERYIAFISDVLALHAQSSDVIERLEISLEMTDKCGQLLVPPSIRAAERWIQYAVRQGVKSFDLELFLPEYHYVPNNKTRKHGGKEKLVTMVLDGLPRSANLKTMYLNLSNARVRFPATVLFPSLVDLTLDSMEIAGDNGHLVGLLSSPRLQRLRMCDVVLPGRPGLLLDAATLVELSLEGIYKLRSLELRTPNLRVLRIEWCYRIKALTVLAPKLEEVVSLHNTSLIHLTGELPCVSSLNLDLSSHGYIDGRDGGNNSSIRLLKRCSSVRVLTVSLNVPGEKRCPIDIIKDRVQQLPHVTSLEVEDVVRIGVAGTSAFLSDHTYGWSANKISLGHLKEAKLMGLITEDSELTFLKYVLASATNLEKVVVSFDKFSPESGRDEFRHMLLGGGTWTPCRDSYESYEWRP